MKKIYLHIDFDAFFASVEENALSNYQQEPLIVCGILDNTVCCSANYIARQYGVKAGMPVFMIKKLVPKNTLYVQTRLDLYERISKEIFNYLKQKYSNEIIVYSVDECWLVFHVKTKKYEDYVLNKAKQIQDDILKTYKLSCSIGIGRSMFLAKMASDFKKPFGITSILTDDDIQNKLWPLPINKMFMVGKNLTKKLNEIDIYTIKDLALCKNYRALKKILTINYIDYLMNANGKDNEIVLYNDKQKSFSIKRTFFKPVLQISELYEYLNWMSDELSIYLKKARAKTKRITLFLENKKHHFYRMQLDYQIPIYKEKELKYEIYYLFEKIYDQNEFEIRSLGIVLNKIVYEDCDKQLKLNDLTTLTNEKKSNLIWKEEIKKIINTSINEHNDFTKDDETKNMKMRFRH